MPAKTRQLNTRVDAEDYRKLQEISKRTDIPVTRLVRKAIKNLIKEYSS